MSMQKKKTYEKASLAIFEFEATDVVATSGAGGGVKENGGESSFDIPGDNIWG